MGADQPVWNSYQARSLEVFTEREAACLSPAPAAYDTPLFTAAARPDTCPRAIQR